MVKQKTKVYVAGPYSSAPEANTDAAIEWGNELLAAGYVPFIPHLVHFWHERFPGSYEQWMGYVTEFLLTCDVVLRIPGESPGAERELQIARKHSMPIFYHLQDLLENIPQTGWRTT